MAAPPGEEHINVDRLARRGISRRHRSGQDLLPRKWSKASRKALASALDIAAAHQIQGPMGRLYLSLERRADRRRAGRCRGRRQDLRDLRLTPRRSWQQQLPQTWHFPSRTECLTCHSRRWNFVLGPSVIRLNRDFVYPNGVKDNQLARWSISAHPARRLAMGAARDQIHEDFVEQGKTDKQAWDMTWKATATRDQRTAPPGIQHHACVRPEPYESSGGPIR